MLLTEISTRRTAGFGLVEVMVGMVIGMLGIIIMMQVSTIFGAQKRSTNGGNEALSSGAIIMYSLQGEIGRAGYGFSAYSLMGCNVRLLNAQTLASSLQLNSIAPVTINHPSIPAGDNGTDTLLVVYTKSDKQTKGIHITGNSGVGNYQVQDAQDFSLNDVVIAQQTAPPTCANTLNMGYVNAAAAGFNIPTTLGTAITDGTIYNFGQSTQIVIQAYAIRKSVLTRCDLMAQDCFNSANTTSSTIWIPIADNVVSLKAQYGVDNLYPETSATYVAQTYSNSPPPVAPVPLPAGCTWARLPSVRIALVARNTQIEKTAVTPNPLPGSLTWAGNATDPIDLTSTSAGANWQNYRYALFEATIPLRNVIWLRVQSASSVPPVTPSC